MAGDDGLIGIMGPPDAAYFRRVRRRALRGVAQFLTSALAAWLVLATLLAGSRYFHCTIEDESRLSSCCPEHHDDSAVDGGEFRSTSCCEPRVMQGLPTAQVMRWADIGAAPLVALLPPFRATEPPSIERERVRLARSGIDPPTPSQARAQLMVFLI
jgi:hypothetical protein